MMFEDIGGKIKSVAVTCTVILIILSVIGGIVCFVAGMILIGVLTIGLGILFAWLFSICLYGFGELIENTAQIAWNTRPQNHLSTVEPLTKSHSSETHVDPARAAYLKKLLSEGIITEEEYKQKLSEKG